MKACPACARLYPDDAGFCPADGSPLRSATQVPIQVSGDARVGTLIALRYEVRRVVADGGMGRVYEARDTQTNTRVAVKMLHPDVAADPVSVERFKREFEISRALPHEHIIDVQDFQKEGDTYALVMEFVDGEELRGVLKREKTISPGRIVRMVSQIAIGLDAAHAKKFVHRDLKPDNLFLCGTREGDIVKVLDFGSAKDKSVGAKKLTMLGTAIGSPFYMAPEQAQGLDSLDQRADVWAVATIIYECLTGEVPFSGGNAPMILLAIMTKEALPPSKNASRAVSPIPASVDEFMEHALYKRPEGRIATVGDLANRFGRAYGLDGDLSLWASLPQAELDRRIAEKLPGLLAGASAGPASLGPSGAPSSLAASAMDQAFQAPPPSLGGDALAGVPKGPPMGLILGVVGGVIVVLAIVLLVLFLR